MVDPFPRRMLDSGLFRVEVSLIVGALVVTALRVLIAVCNRRDATAVSGVPIWAGLVVRLAAVAVAAAVPTIGHKLSSTDEAAFLATTHRLAALPLTDGTWLSMAVHWTEVIPWALTFKVFGACGTLPLRLEQIGLSLTAVIIVSATASRIGGRRAGVIAAWVAAIEPSSVYFAGLLHQESLCMVGEALLLAALVDFWMQSPGRVRLTWQAGCAGLIGLALIYGTRSYMAFFAGVAAVLVLLGAGLCNRLGLFRGLLALTIGALVLALAGIFAAPHVVPHSLQSLQHQLNVDYVGANLPLGHADVRSSGGLLKTVVLRSLDLILRPFPWQIGSAAQKAAVAGTLLWYALVLVTGLLALRVGGEDRLVPVVILLICETVGFALTLVDAGEGFRHRINLILMLSVPLGVLADGFLASRSGSRFGHGRTRLRGRTALELAVRSSSCAALAGGLVALGFVLVMPTRYRATVAVELPAGIHVSAPAPAQLTAQAQLYGAFGPGKAPPTLTFSAVATGAPAARAAAGGAARAWVAGAQPQARSRARVEPALVAKSPRAVRDLLLGLLAGLLLGLAAVLVTRPD